MPDKLVLSVSEFAKVMQLSAPKAYELIHSNNGPPVINIGRCIRIPVSGLEAWLNAASRSGRIGGAQ